MKTRNEIYQGEGAQLLRFITTYHTLQYEQVLRLFPKNRDSIKSLITSLVKQKRIVHDKENGILCDSQESANTPDYGMIASFWVLLDFKKAIVYHTDGEFPIKLNFFSKDEWYEVLYVPQEQEYLINHVMESQPKNDAKRLVVLEKEEQAAKLHIKGVIAFCLVDSTTGSVSYYACMNTKTVFNRLQSIDDEVQKLHNTIFALKTTDIQAYADKYEELSISAALRSERIACQLRNLVYTTTDTRKADYLKQAAAVQGIKIFFSNSVLSITMPGLLPKRKLRTNTAFLHEPLNLALQTYVTEHYIPLYKRCVVCFSQIYDQNLSLQRIRDYDNLEFKQILDTIASYVLVDDTGLFCDSYHTTELGNYDHTVIFVMEPEIFPGWLKNRKSSIKTISEIS